PAADSAARRAAHVRTARIRPARAAARAASLATGSHVFHRVHDRRSCGGLEVARTAAPILIETPFAPAQLPTAISQLPNIGGGPANTRRVQGSHSRRSVQGEDRDHHQACPGHAPGGQIKYAHETAPERPARDEDTSGTRPRKHFPPLVN